MDKLTLQEIDQWMSGYYKYPQPEFTPLAIEGLSKEKKLVAINSAEPIMFFLSFIFRANPDKIVEWTSPFIASLSLRGKEAIINSLWLSNTQSAKDYLSFLATSSPDVKKYINYLVSEPLPNLEEISIDRPGILDILWAAFMATGEKKYIIPIISALANCDNKDDGMKQLIGNSARWSLKSNIKNHPIVKSTCIAQLDKQSPNVVAILQNIIEGENDLKK